MFQKIVKSLFRFAKEVVVLSELEQRILKDKFRFTNSIVLSNSIDVDKYRCIMNRSSLVSPILLFLGRVEKNKGILEIIASLKLLKGNFDFRFILCGNGNLLDFCKEECEKFLGPGNE